MLGEPDCTWISAPNESGVRLSTADPTEEPASLVFVVQSPWAGLSVPNATVWPVPGVVAAGDGSKADAEVNGVEVFWLLEQADTKTKAATSMTARVRDRRGPGSWSFRFQVVCLVPPGFFAT